MDITPTIPNSAVQLNGYGGGGFKINNEQMQGSRIFTNARHEEWPIAHVHDIAPDSFHTLESDWPEIDIMIIGTGNRMATLPAAIMHYLRSKNTAVEVMDSGAACRTFNILQSEGRRVAAAIIAV